MESGLELKIMKNIALMSSPENDLMLTDDLLNKYRQTLPISDCQILDNSLANIPCLGQLQTLIWAESLEIIHLVQGRGPKNHTLYPAARPRIQSGIVIRFDSQDQNKALANHCSNFCARDIIA